MKGTFLFFVLLLTFFCLVNLALAQSEGGVTVTSPLYEEKFELAFAFAVLGFVLAIVAIALVVNKKD